MKEGKKKTLDGPWLCGAPLTSAPIMTSPIPQGRWGLLRWLSEKNPPANAGDVGSISGWGRSSGVGKGNPL